MISMIRAMAKLCVATLAVAAFLPTAPSHAETVVYVSPAGSGGTCSAALPCADIPNALVVAGASSAGNSALVACLSGSAVANNGYLYGASNETLDIDCPQGFIGILQFSAQATNATVRVRHLTFENAGFTNLFSFHGSGTVILEDCVFTDATSTALDIEPNGPLNLVIRNSRISNSAAGILLKPAAGGSINATFDHVTITNNSGGGLRTDGSNGPINVDISDSVISDNAGNGLNISSGTGTQNTIANITRTTIAKNGAVGIQAGGSNGAVLLDTTLLDSNANGATLLNGGRILSYGNNRIVGSAGSGFTGSASLQ